MTIIESTKKGKDIEKHLSGMDMEPWFYIYANYVNSNEEKRKNTDMESFEES